MTFARTAQPDPVQEFRLRAWARRNHVPADQRLADWHPVVLDEMARRDREASRPSFAARSSAPVSAAPWQSVSDAVPVPRYVPLAPLTIHVRHEAHEDLAAPHLATFDAAWSVGEVHEVFVG